MCSETVRSRPVSRVIRLVSGSALVLLASACAGHYVVRGTDLYQEGRYVEAAEVFEKTEQRLRESSNTERARFGLYRGATFLKLGDVPHAARWLGYSRSILKLDPEALEAPDSALLDASLEAVGHVERAVPARSDTSELAAVRPLSSDTVPAP